MFIPFVIPVAATLILTAADQVPTFDVTPSCRAAAEASGGQDRLQTCVQSEQNARDELVRTWSQYSTSDRSLCSQPAGVGGEPTYTELITCLEMARDTRNPPNRAAESASSPTTSGMAPDQGVPSGTTPGMLHRQPRRPDGEGMK